MIPAVFIDANVPIYAAGIATTRTRNRAPGLANGAIGRR